MSALETVLHLKSKTDSAGALHLEVGVPDAAVDVTVTMRGQPAKHPKPRLIDLLRNIQPDAVEEFPDSPVRDPWEE